MEASSAPLGPVGALDKAIKLAGSQQRLADRINTFLPEGQRIGQSAISNWRQRRQVPSEMTLHVCRAVDYGVLPNQIRSDLYPHPDDGLPENLRDKAGETLSAALDLLKPEEAAAVAAAIGAGREVASKTIDALDIDLAIRTRLLEAARRAGAAS